MKNITAYDIMHELFEIILTKSRNPATGVMQTQQMLERDYPSYLLKLSANARTSADSKVGSKVISLENKTNKKTRVSPSISFHGKGTRKLVQVTSNPHHGGHPNSNLL